LANVQIGIREIQSRNWQQHPNFARVRVLLLEQHTLRFSPRMTGRCKFLCFLWIYYRQSSSSFSTIAKRQYGMETVRMNDADMMPRLLKSPLFEEDGKRGVGVEYEL